MKLLNHFSTVIVSDILILGKPAGAKQMLKYLKTFRWEKIIIYAGDNLIDYNNSCFISFIEKISQIALKFDSQIIIYDPHHTGGLNSIFPNLTICKEYTLQTFKGSYNLTLNKFFKKDKSLFIQGKIFVYKLFSHISRRYNIIRLQLGLSYRSNLRLQEFQNKFFKADELEITRFISTKECKGIITQAFPAPSINLYGKTEYLNVGLWSESKICLAADMKGKWRLLSYEEAKNEFKDATKHHKLTKQLFKLENNTQTENSDPVHAG